MILDADDAVIAVLVSWGVDRGAVLVRRFDHGVGGTSLITIDGRHRVLKAWPLRSEGDEARLDSALALAEIMRRRGVVVPALIERGRAAGHGYLVFEYVGGDWSDEFGPEAVDDLMMIIDAGRGAAPAPNRRWPAELETMLTAGDPSFDIAPDVLAASASAEPVLTEARRRFAACDPTAFRTADIVHGDFAPENLLLRDGRVVGVVDWERARTGDVGLDLIGAIFDIEIGRKAPMSLRQQLWTRARERMPADVLATYVGLYAVRYLSWAVGTEMEDEVLALADLMLTCSTITSSPAR